MTDEQLAAWCEKQHQRWLTAQRNAAEDMAVANVPDKPKRMTLAMRRAEAMLDAEAKRRSEEMEWAKVLGEKTE